ncbi:amidohydrolase family protein [Roseovarius sp. Pro17]|uniref:amidohydrolase family protein n=1 Tax=Roseovarius sp. Pro17 TaxID=3108175 RepID=UPI002D7910F0|nr:amidohydrolase family protein [Roseovarius sp. Pro17]
MATMNRRDYANMYGPTKGDPVRLGDTNLYAEVEHDFALPGDECLHGGGKTLRDGLGLTPGFDSAMGALDMLLCNATVIDPVLGIIKGDVGIKDGKIVGVGKAGNPGTMDGVHPNLICGAATTVRDAEGLIATPGGIDVHVHFDSAQLCDHAIASGLTTMMGGSLGPITVGIDCGGAFNVGKMIQASEAFPLNFGFLGRGNTSKPRSIYDQILGGAVGLKIHEDWGAMAGATLTADRSAFLWASANLIVLICYVLFTKPVSEYCDAACLARRTARSGNVRFNRVSDPLETKRPNGELFCVLFFAHIMVARHRKFRALQRQ